MHFQYSLLASDTTFKTSAADFVGDYTAGGHIINVGVTLGVAFDGKKEERP